MLAWRARNANEVGRWRQRRDDELAKYRRRCVGNPFVKKNPKRHLKIFQGKCGEVGEELLAFVAAPRTGECATTRSMTLAKTSHSGFSRISSSAAKSESSTSCQHRGKTFAKGGFFPQDGAFLSNVCPTLENSGNTILHLCIHTVGSENERSSSTRLLLLPRSVCIGRRRRPLYYAAHFLYRKKPPDFFPLFHPQRVSSTQTLHTPKRKKKKIPSPLRSPAPLSEKSLPSSPFILEAPPAGGEGIGIGMRASPHSARTENHAHIASSPSPFSESAHLWKKKWRKEEDCTFSYLQLGGEGGGACEQGFLPPSFNLLLIASCAEPIRQVFPHSFPIQCTSWRVFPQTKSICIRKVTVSKR